MSRPWVRAAISRQGFTDALSALFVAFGLAMPENKQFEAAAAVLTRSDRQRARAQVDRGTAAWDAPSARYAWQLARARRDHGIRKWMPNRWFLGIVALIIVVELSATIGAIRHRHGWDAAQAIALLGVYAWMLTWWRILPARLERAEDQNIALLQRLGEPFYADPDNTETPLEAGPDWNAMAIMLAGTAITLAILRLASGPGSWWTGLWISAVVGTIVGATIQRVTRAARAR